jgi:hypothetical protein
VKSQGGFFHRRIGTKFPTRDSRSFQKIVDAFLGGKDVPFAEVLSAERIERVFQKHGRLFGLHGAYTTAIMVWSFLSQALRDGKEGSCQVAVARVVSYCRMQGLRPQRMIPATIVELVRNYLRTRCVI